MIEGLERAPQIGGGEASGGTGNRVVGGGEGGVKSMGDSGFGSIGGGGGGGGIVVSKSGADDPITPAPAPSGGGEAGGGSGETKTITLN